MKLSLNIESVVCLREAQVSLQSYTGVSLKLNKCGLCAKSSSLKIQLNSKQVLRVAFWVGLEGNQQKTLASSGVHLL